MALNHQYHHTQSITTINANKHFHNSNKSPQQNPTSPRNYFPRNIHNTKRAQVRKAAKQTNEQILVHIQSQELSSELNYYRIKGLVLIERQGICEQKEVILISKIEHFYEQYNTFFHSHYSTITNLHWIILTNAINNAEIEKEFNQNYQPINFTILRSIQDIANYIDFFKEQPKPLDKTLSYFSRIINFSNYENHYACILQYGHKVEMNRPSQNNELWLVSKSQLKNLITKPYRCYYLSEHSVKRQEIQVIESQSKILFVMVAEDWGLCLQQAGIKKLESAFTPLQIKVNLYNAKEIIYCEKVIQNYLANQVILNLVNFPLELAQVFMKYSYITQNMSFSHHRHRNVYSVYYGEKSSQDKLGFKFNEMTDSLQEEIMQIKVHFEKLFHLQDQYEEISNYLASFLLKAYNIRNQALLDELQYFTGNKIPSIQDIQQLQQLPLSLPIILLSSIDLPLSSNITLIKYSFQQNYQIHQAIINFITNLHNKSTPIQYCSTLVTNFSHQLLEIEPFHPYYKRQIKDFSFFLKEVQENTSHLIILEMNDYSQERQRQLKEIELCKNINMQVYLLYANQFISRSTNNKYTFLKKEQLLSKIRSIIHQNQQQQHEIDLGDIHQQYYSDLKEYRERPLCQTYSTPHLTQPNNNSQVIICIPKGVPYYSLTCRSIHPYSLLVYSRIQQALEMTKYIPSGSYAVIFTSIKQAKRIRVSNKHMCELNVLECMGQKQLRREVDRIIERFRLQKKRGDFMNTSKKVPTVILYDHNQQVRAISTLNNLFTNSKIITMSKKQYKLIMKSYCIASNICFYQIGKPQFKHATYVATVLQLFQLYMSPFIAHHSYTTDQLQFSLKQLFIKQLIECRRVKNNRKSHITLSRSLSPKSKHILQKQCIYTDPGLAILESSSISKLKGKEVFNSWQSLVSLSLAHLSKGKQIVVMVREDQLFQLKDQVNIYKDELTWIVIVTDFKKCIIRQPNIVFCKEEQFEKTLTLVIESYQLFKTKCLQLSQASISIMNHLLTRNSSFSTKTNPDHNTYHINIISQLPSKPSHQLNFYFNPNMRDCSFESLDTAFPFNSKTNLHNALTPFTTQERISDDSQNISIVCQLHNKRFLQQSLQLLNQTRYLLTTLSHMGELISYSSPCKSIFVIEKTYKLIHTHIIALSPEETPAIFSRRLKIMIEGVRKY